MSASASSAPRTVAQPSPGAWQTITRGVRLSPELRVGLPVTLLLALLATAGRVVVPVAVQLTVDEGLRGPSGVDVPTVVTVVGGAGIAVLMTAIASGFMNARMATVTERALSSMRIRAFRHIHDLSMLHQAAEQRGSLVSRVTTDIDEISRFMQWGGLNLITSVGQLTVAAIVMFVYSWQLTLVVLAAFVPFLVAGRWFQQRLTRAYRHVRARLGDLLAVLAETVVGAPVVRAYGIERRTQQRLDHAIEGHRLAALDAGRLSSLFSGTGELFAATATMLLVVAGVLLSVAGQVSPGRVLAFLFLITLFVQPVQIAAEVVNEGQNAVAGWQRVLDVLDIAPDVADPQDGQAIPAGPISIAFDHVDFRYPRPGEPAAAASGPWVLHDVHLDVAPRTKVAVVGETGSGKTTFAKLLTRLMDPSTGEVRLSGAPLDRIAFDSLRRRVVMVPQDGMLFDGTIADNVRHGRPDAAARDLELAFTELGLSSWLEELPRHLETPVGERGSALSAGERQLVALARAYIANPDLLVLDEATSAVDPATEVRLQRALSGLTEGRTTVTIAHRMSTAEQADDVVVFDDGRIVQHGAHAELVADGGVYGRLHASWVRTSARARD